MEICVRPDMMPGMRKWVVAGLAVIAIGAGVYLFSQPRIRSVEHHKEEYLKGPGAVHRWVDNHHLPAISEWFWQRFEARKEFHYRALIELGYLEERVFGLFNHFSGPNDEMHSFFIHVRHLVNENTNITTDFSRILNIQTNSIRIVGLPEEMGHWAEIVGEADWDGLWVHR